MVPFYLFLPLLCSSEMSFFREDVAFLMKTMLLCHVVALNVFIRVTVHLGLGDIFPEKLSLNNWDWL